jgi:hypothetical protein
MATVHEAFVGSAQMDSVFAFADLISDDEACIAARLQIPGVIERRRAAVPADADGRDELVHLALDRQSECGPSKYDGVFQHGIASDLDLLRVRIPFGPFTGVDDVAPNALARGVDQ